MTETGWKQLITDLCTQAGTYKPFFEPTIDTLAWTLAARDKAKEEYKSHGSQPIIGHTNKAGATNPCKNPYLVLVNDLNTSALSYWRDLGLTAKAYKDLSGEKTGEKKTATLENMLARLGV